MTDAERPLLRVVRGQPSAEELAALIAVMTARAGSRPAPSHAPSAWTDRSRLVRRPVSAGPAAWRASAWRD